MVSLEECGEWGSGGTPKRTNPRYYLGGKIPWLVIGDLNDGVVNTAASFITEEGLRNSSAKVLPVNTLLVAMYGSIGKLGITGIECATNQAVAFCIANEKIVDTKYLFYSLMNAKEELISLGQGGTQQNISQTILKNFRIPVAPLNEQTRITDKLDSLMARLNACRAHLDRVPGIIKELRRAVLAAAVSGRLTRDWRDLKHLSNDWEETTLADVGIVSGGLTKNPGRSSLKLRKPYLRVANVFANILDLSDIAEIGLTEEEFKKTKLEKDDLLIVEGNGSIDQIGRAAIWSNEISECVHQNHIIKWRSSGSVLPKFVLYWLLSPQGRSTLARLASSTSGLNTLSISKVSSILMARPSIEEQIEIVKRVEILFILADRLQSHFQSSQNFIDKFSPTLPAKAFRGELIPQDSNDDPASVLLERIRLERHLEELGAAIGRTPAKKESGKKDEERMRTLSEIKPTHLSDILKENGSMLAERLWAASDLAIEDFYDQLKDEELKGLLREIRNPLNDLVSVLEQVKNEN